MRQPAWFLLLWAAFVASLVSSTLGFAARSHLGERSPGRAILLGILLGTLLWGPLYGFTFELVGSANAIGGALFGTLHGAIAAAFRLLRRSDRPAARRPLLAGIQGRRIITRVVYGAVLGFLYVVPGR